MNFIILLIFFLLLIFYIFGLVYLNYGLLRLNKHKEEKFFSISIVVSMHNEENNVEACIDSLVNQDYPKDKMEIILINDRSSDQTNNLFLDIDKKHSFIKIINIDDIKPNFAPKKFAIDTAVRQAKGDIILLTDADGRPQKSWAKIMVSYFSKDVGMVIGYAPYSFKDNSFFNQLFKLEYFSHAVVAASTCGNNYPLTCVGTNMAYRKDTFLQLDGFGIFSGYHSGDDDLFLQRVRDESNWQIRYATDSDAHVYNFGPSNWKKFYQQRLRYASKGFFYPGKVTLILMLFYLLNLFFLLLPLLAILNSGFLIAFIIGLILKIVSEVFLFYQAQRIFNSDVKINLIPIVSILHIPYVLYFGLLAQFQKFEWAGLKRN